ncbi:MAG: Lrp/AsnC family transcriptional regulator [Candidatus Lokiarchaeota archaeon]|nr:Lrp/AsnC family transcriptional regulator [Candidatus Lokiarchaeota archaeon]
MDLPSKIPLDDIDKQIIDLLQKDPNITHSQIAEMIERSQPTVGARLKKLKKSGVLAINAGLNLKFIDLYLSLVRLKTNNPSEINEMAAHCPFIANCFQITGDFNMLLFLVSSDLEKLYGLVNSHFRNKGEIQEVKMEVVVEIARDFVVPVNLDLQEHLDPGAGDCSYCKNFSNT